MPSIRAAKDWRRRPSAVIMGDDWFGHRNPRTGEPRGDKEEYTRWDYALMSAFQTIEDYTDPKSGLPIWELDDERVVVSAVRRINKFDQAVALRTAGKKNKPYTPIPGEYFIPHVECREKNEDGSDKFQTITEWIQKQVEKDT